MREIPWRQHLSVQDRDARATQQALGAPWLHKPAVETISTTSLGLGMCGQDHQNSSFAYKTLLPTVRQLHAAVKVSEAMGNFAVLRAAQEL